MSLRRAVFSRLNAFRRWLSGLPPEGPLTLDQAHRAEQRAAREAMFVFNLEEARRNRELHERIRRRGR